MRRRWKELLLALLAVVASVAMVEGGYRLLADKEHEPVVPQGVGQFDPDLGWAPKPNAVGVSSASGVPVEYRISSHGLRDDETTFEKPAGVFRIVLLGDSFTFGYGLAIDHHYSRLLETYFKNVEVINMGVSGYGVDQMLLMLGKRGLNYDPDLVIVFVPFYWNHRHMHAHRFGQDKPRFVLEDGRLRLTNWPVVEKDSEEPGPLGRVHAWVKERLRSYRDIRVMAGVDPDPGAGRRDEDRINRENRYNRDYLDEMYALGEAIVAEMHALAAENGARFVLVTRIPPLHQAAVERGILSLDVTAALGNDAFPLPNEVGHMNDAGNGVLAWEIARFLVAEGLVGEAHLRVPHCVPELPCLPPEGP